MRLEAWGERGGLGGRRKTKISDFGKNIECPLTPFSLISLSPTLCLQRARRVGFMKTGVEDREINENGVRGHSGGDAFRNSKTGVGDKEINEKGVRGHLK